MSSDNTVILIGRVVRDAEMKISGEDNKVRTALFTLAVDRHRGNGADYPNVVAFGKMADVIVNHCPKGTKLVIKGHLQTNSYEKDGEKIYTTTVAVEELSFAESRASAQLADEGVVMPDASDLMPRKKRTTKAKKKASEKATEKVETTVEEPAEEVIEKPIETAEEKPTETPVETKAEEIVEDIPFTEKNPFADIDDDDLPFATL